MQASADADSNLPKAKLCWSDELMNTFVHKQVVDDDKHDLDRSSFYTHRYTCMNCVTLI